MELVTAYMKIRNERIKDLFAVATVTIRKAVEHFKSKPNTPEVRAEMQKQLNFALEKLERENLPSNRFIMVDIEEQETEIKVTPYFADSEGNRLDEEQILLEIIAMGEKKKYSMGRGEDHGNYH